MKNIEDTLNRFSIGKSARDLEDLASIAKAGLIIANRAVSVSWVKNTHTGYFAKVKSILYIFRARAVIILCLFGPQLDVSSLNKEKTFVLENLTGAIDMASEIGIDTIVFNGAVEMWNLYRSIKTDTIGAEKEWLNLFIKLCPVLNKLRMKDSSIFVNMSAASVLLILDEYKTASETKSKFKAGAKPGKEDQSLVFLSQADEICQSAISKTNASFESTVYIITVWAQLLCVKTEAGMEPIEDQGDLVRLLSSLELAELSAGSQITVDVQSVLSKAVCSFKNSKITSQSIQLETLLRVTQVAMKKDLLKFSYGCLQELQAVGVNEISQSPETKKVCKLTATIHFSHQNLIQLLCDFGLIYGQVLLRLLGKSELYTTRANMVAEAFGAFIKCFESSLGLTGDLKFLRNKSLEGILLLLTEWQSSLDLHSACICVKNAVSLLKEGPKVSSSRRNLDNLIQKDIVCTLLERVLDICIGLKWQELGIAICDMWDNVTPKDTKCNIQRYRVLGLTGLSSPVIKLSEEDMARVWLQTAQQARNFQEKEAAFTKCIHHASKCSLKLEAYISYAEWKVTENCSTVAQDILDDIKCIIDPSNESDTPRSISADLLKLRALCLLSKTEASIETKANFIDRAKELLRSLVETTQANSINFMPVAEEAVKDTSKKGKKEPNKESNSAKSANAEDLPGEDGWQSYTWSAAAHNCFLNCQIPTCFSRHSVPDRRSLLSSILVLAEEAGLSNLLDAFFISIRVIELVSLKESKEMLATTSLMEMDVLYRNGQTPANLEKYKKSHFYRLSSVSDYKSNITMVPQAMIIQAKLHLKYGDALNAKKCLSDVLKFDGVIQEPIIKLEAVSLLSLCFYLLGDYEKSHALASKSLANAPSPFIFTNSSLVLLISWSAKDICQKKDQLAFISSCTDRLVSLVASNENGEACRSLMFLFWVKLRILVSTVDNTSEQYLETLKKTYQDCLKWSRVSTKMERYAPIQLDFFKGLKKAVSMSPKNARRQVFNFTVNVAKDIQDYLEFKSGNLDETDYELLIEVAGFELDSPLHSSETKVSRTIEDMLDDYLGEPILAIPMKSCERLINLDFEALPVRLRGAALFLAGTYTEKFSDTGNPDVKGNLGHLINVLLSHFSHLRKEPLQFFSGSISPLVTNGSKEFLMKALERVIDKQISEDPMKAFK